MPYFSYDLCHKWHVTDFLRDLFFNLRHASYLAIINQPERREWRTLFFN